MENISAELKKLSFSIGSSESSNLSSSVKDALKNLLYPKFKKSSFEILSCCIKQSPAEAKFAIIEELKSITLELDRNISSKIFLVYMDAPKHVKNFIFDNPHFICEYSISIIHGAAEALLLDKQSQKEDSSSLLEEVLFNGIKVTIQILQNIGSTMIKKIFNDEAESSWENKWIDQTASVLISVIKSKGFYSFTECVVAQKCNPPALDRNHLHRGLEPNLLPRRHDKGRGLDLLETALSTNTANSSQNILYFFKQLQKETLNMAGITLAHIVQNVPSSVYSIELVKLILQVLEKNDVLDAVVGPINIREIQRHEVMSELSIVSAINGLLTVLSPDLLLFPVELSYNQEREEDVLHFSFKVLYKSCLHLLDAEQKYYCFQVLSTWLDTVSRITLQSYHSFGKKETLFMSSSFVCERIMELVWENREDMADGVPKVALHIFGKLLELHQIEKSVLGGPCINDKLIYSVLLRLMKDPWYIRGRYTLLCEVFRHVEPAQVLLVEPSFPASLCQCFGASNLASAANECYKAFIASKSPSSGKANKHWNKYLWESVFKHQFIEMLISDNVRSTENCTLYFIPTTLLLIPDCFLVMQDAVLNDLSHEFSSDNQSKQEWNRIRRHLCFGYCAVMKFGRKMGLTSFQDINENILQESLDHVDDDLRAEAFAVLCNNNKTTETISTTEQHLIERFLQDNLNCASSAFRQTVFVSMKIVLARVRDSSILLLREYKKAMKRQKLTHDFAHAPEMLVRSIDMIENIVSLSLGCLFPGASFQRKKTGLQLIYAVLETFSSPKDAAKRGRTADSLKTLTDWTSAAGRWNFINFRNLEILVSCFEDQHDEIRELAFDILKWFEFGMTTGDVEKLGRKLIMQASDLASSPRIHDAESGAILFEFLALRFLKWDASSIFEITKFEAEDQDVLLDPHKFDGIVHLILTLLRIINKHVDKAYDDILNAATKEPIFGLLMVSRRCFSLLLKHLSSAEQVSVQIDKHVFALLIEESIKTCKKSTILALSIFKHDGATGGSPSFADMNDALDEAMRNCTSFKTTEELIGYQHCLELMSSFCWLNIKAATLFLGELGRVVTLESLTMSDKKEILPDYLFSQIGGVFRETLVKCRHKGVIENSNVGFQKLCRSVTSISSMTKLLNGWLMETIDAVDRHDFNSSITKRSAGLPMFLQPILAACISSRRFPFATYIEKLIEIASRPLTDSEIEQSDLPQVQAMNILKTVYRDSSLGFKALKYAQDGLILSIIGFSSHSWAVRNAAQILLGALVPRMLGQRVTQAEKAHHNSITASKFFKTFPKLGDFFIGILKSGSQPDQQLKSLPALIPVLTMLSKLRPCNKKKYQLDFYPLLKDLLCCPVFTVRKLAASTLVLFTPREDMISLIENFTASPDHQNENFNHGFLLMIKHLIEINQDDSTFSDRISTNVFLEISNSLLKTEVTVTLASCTLLEIYAFLLRNLCMSAKEEDMSLRCHIHTTLKHMVEKTSYDIDHENGLETGIHLFTRRLAQDVVCFAFYGQSNDQSDADDLLVRALTSPNRLLSTESAKELTHYLEHGHFMKTSMKFRIFAAVCNRIDVLEDSERNAVLMDCCFHTTREMADVNISLETVIQLLQDCIKMKLSGSSHRLLAALIPFIAIVIRSFCIANTYPSPKNEDFLKLIAVWSAWVADNSAADAREMLRWSSLKAVQVSAESIFKLYDNFDESVDTYRCGILAKTCARLLFATLKLIQDEDEEIRNSASDISLVIYEKDGDKNKHKLQTNLALKKIFSFITNKMTKNSAIIEMLCEYLINILDLDRKFVIEPRSAMLFEQESPNLFAENLIFGKEIIGCLEALVSHAINGSCERENQVQKYPDFFPLIKDARKQIMQRLTSIVANSALLSSFRRMRYYGDFGRPNTFLLLCLATHLLPVLKSICTEGEMTEFQELLETILEMQDMHPFLAAKFNERSTFLESRENVCNKPKVFKACSY